MGCLYSDRVVKERGQGNGQGWREERLRAGRREKQWREEGEKWKEGAEAGRDERERGQRRKEGPQNRVKMERN